MSNIDSAPISGELGESRVMTAMMTPFFADETVNFDVAQDMAHYLVTERGNDGLVIAGTTGESPAMDVETTLQLVRCVREAVGNQVELVVGTADMITSGAVKKTRLAAEQGLADRFLLVNSPYNRPHPEGVLDYFQRVNDAAQEVNPDFEGIVYNIPSRTGTYIDLETMRRIAVGMDAFTALKDAAPGKDTRTHDDVWTILNDENGDFAEFDVYSGDDSRNHELYVSGAVGAISVYGHWAGIELGAMFDAIENSDADLASAYDKALEGSAEFETMDWAKNPTPTRAMMRYLGFNAGFGVSPMVHTNADTMARLDGLAETTYRQLQGQVLAIKNPDFMSDRMGD